jgi:hypothetical protein
MSTPIYVVDTLKGGRVSTVFEERGLPNNVPGNLDDAAIYPVGPSPSIQYVMISDNPMLLVAWLLSC